MVVKTATYSLPVLILCRNTTPRHVCELTYLTSAGRPYTYATRPWCVVGFMGTPQPSPHHTPSLASLVSVPSVLPPLVPYHHYLPPNASFLFSPSESPTPPLPDAAVTKHRQRGARYERCVVAKRPTPSRP